MSFGGVGIRFVELGERKRGLQSEAARVLSVRDSDGGSEGFLGGVAGMGIVLEQNFALTAKKDRVRPVFSILLRDATSSIEASALSVRPALASRSAMSP